MLFPKVSVIVAAYQERDLLPLVLRQLAAQDYAGPWEVLVCDDGGGDLLPILQDASQRSGMDLRYIWQPNRGRRVARSRNNGIRCATGQLGIFTDADMIVAPDFITRHVELHDGNRRVICGSRRLVYFDQAQWQRIRSFPSGELLEELRQGPYYSDRGFQRQAMLTKAAWIACMTCNCSVYPLGEAFFDEQFVGWGFEDQEFALRLVRNLSYELLVSFGVESFHLEAGSGPPASMLRPKTHNQIVAFFRGLLHLLDSHPAEDMAMLKSVVLSFQLDVATNRWRRGPHLSRIATVPDRQVEFIRRWLAENAPAETDNSSDIPGGASLATAEQS